MENYEGEGDTLRMGIELTVPVCRNRNDGTRQHADGKSALFGLVLLQLHVDR